MGRIKEFFTKQEDLKYLVILFLFLSLTIWIAFLYQSSSNIKEEEKQHLHQIELLTKVIRESEGNSKLLIDSAGIYKLYAEKQQVETEKIHTKIIYINSKTNEEIKHLSTLSSDSQLILLPSLARAYKDSL